MIIGVDLFVCIGLDLAPPLAWLGRPEKGDRHLGDGLALRVEHQSGNDPLPGLGPQPEDRVAGALIIIAAQTYFEVQVVANGYPGQAHQAHHVAWLQVLSFLYQHL